MGRGADHGAVLVQLDRDGEPHDVVQVDLEGSSDILVLVEEPVGSVHDRRKLGPVPSGLWARRPTRGPTEAEWLAAQPEVAAVKRTA